MLREDLRTVRGSALILTLVMRKRCPHDDRTPQRHHRKPLDPQPQP